MTDRPLLDLLPDPPMEAVGVLERVFGYKTFRPSQGGIVGRLIAGQDAVLVMPTGGGKSLCYQIPALVRAGTGLVVSPLIALMQDQVEALQQVGVKAEFLNSTLGEAQQRKILARLHAGDLDLLYVAPERLMTPSFLDRLATIEWSLLAIDEAHCISQWGHDFRPEYRDLGRVRRMLPHVPCLAVTATADAPTQRDLLRQLDLPDESLFVTGFDRPNIRYRVDLSHEPKKQLLAFLEDHAGEAGIVYCLSRDKTEQTATYLSDHGIPALPYHAGLPAKTRAEHQERFLREEGLVMCATIAFGMGIDKPNVRFVVHMDMPKSPEAYYQETGRAGRDGEPSEAWMLYSLAAVVQQRRMIDKDGGGANAWVERRKLDAMVGYCETAACRRRVLLGYFGEDGHGDCGNCDTCLHPVATWDATRPAQMLFSAAARTGQRFGAAHLIAVLRGEGSAEAIAKVRKFGHDRLPTFGVGTELSETAWRSVVRQLTAGGFLDVDVEGYGALRLTDAAAPVLKGQQTVQLRVDPTPARKGRAARAPKEAFVTTSEGERVFARLRDLRLRLAKEQGVPPYVIFGDKTLREMSETVPTTREALRQVSGVGEAKLERYGDAFLDVLRDA